MLNIYEDVQAFRQTHDEKQDLDALAFNGGLLTDIDKYNVT